MRERGEREGAEEGRERGGVREGGGGRDREGERAYTMRVSIGRQTQTDAGRVLEAKPM